MMVLGNIVAVTSIIAVVSLIQGMDGYVADAIIKDVGAGTFKIERVGLITDEEQEERARRSNPVITLLDASAVRGEPDDRRRDGRIGHQRQHHLPRRPVETVRVRGRVGEYDQFSSYAADEGRLPSRLEIERGRPVALLGWDTADKLFKGRSAVDQLVKIDGVALPRRRREREEGLRSSATRRTSSR